MGMEFTVKDLPEEMQRKLQDVANIKEITTQKTKTGIQFSVFGTRKDGRTFLLVGTQK